MSMKRSADEPLGPGVVMAASAVAPIDLPPAAGIVGDRMLGVVLNPNAVGIKRNPALAARLRAIAGDAGEVVTTFDMAGLDAAIDRFVSRGCDTIAICGGDGTNLSTLTALVARCGAANLPRVAILRGGTVNTVARNLGIRGQPDALLGRLVNALRGGGPLPIQEHDLIAVSDDGAPRTRYGFLFAAAMGARFIEAYYGGPPGAAWAMLMAVRIAGSSLVQGPYASALFAPVEVELTADGERQPITGARLLLASTIPDVGIGMRVMWQAGRDPRRFHLLASAISTTHMALQLPRVLSGRPLSGSPHVDRPAAEATMAFRKPEVWTLDGELYRAQELSVRVGPRLRIVRC